MTKEQALKFGVIGCGHVVQTVHLPAWRPIKSAQLAAICDTSPSALESVGSRYPGARRYREVDDFLADARDLDFVVLATPGDSHATIGEQVLNCGLHLLCEKPLALNEGGAKRLYEIAGQQGVLLTPIQNYIYRDTVIKALAYKEIGGIGDVTSLNVRSRSGYLLSDAAVWRRDERIHRVLLFDFAIHFIHLALVFGGPVSSLRFVDAQVNSAGLQYVVFGTLHENGCRGLFELIIDSPSTGTEIEVLGKAGGFALDFFPHGFRVLPRHDTPLHRGMGDGRRLLKFGYDRIREYLPQGMAERAIPHSRLFSAFVGAIQGAGPNPVSEAGVVETISLLSRVADRAYAAAGVSPKRLGATPQEAARRGHPAGQSARKLDHYVMRPGDNQGDFSLQAVSQNRKMNLGEDPKHRQFYTNDVPPILVAALSDIDWDSCLDLGCGDGVLLSALKNQGYLNGKSVFAVDTSPSRIDLVKGICEDFNCIVADGCNTPIEDGAIDLLISTQVIEHVSNDHDMVKAMHQLLRQDGLLYLATVFKKKYGWYFYRCNGKWTLDPGHLREYTADDQLLDILRACGFEILVNNKTLYRYPITDSILRRLGMARHAYDNRFLKKMRNLRVPIPGYYLWELVCQRV